MIIKMRFLFSEYDFVLLTVQSVEAFRSDFDICYNPGAKSKAQQIFV